MTPTKKIRVAMADDSAFQRQMLKLYASIYEDLAIVIDVDNGAELIVQLDKCKFLPHVCILDLHMPIMDGVSTARFLRETYPRLHLFGYTSSADKEEISFYSSFVKKIFSKSQPQALLKEINHLLSSI